MFNLIKIYFFFLNKIINYKRICIINSPSQLICLKEFFFSDQKNIKTLIIFGYSTNSGIIQIKSMYKELEFNNEIIYLSDRISEKKFQILLKFLKIFFIPKITIIGDINYYISKGIYKFSKKVFFLDEGINNLIINEKKLKKNYHFFSILPLKDSKIIYEPNNYNYLKKKIGLYNIKKDLVYILGTSDSHYDVLNVNLYHQLIKKICNKFSEKNIIFIPHRNEDSNKIKKLNITNLEILNINYPIEYFLTKKNELPEFFLAFYSMALINLKILLSNENTKIFNIKYDLDTLHEPNLAKLYRKYEKLFLKLKIDQID